MYFSTLEDLINHLSLETLSFQKDYMILVGEASAHHVPELIEALNELNLPFFGGIYPRLLVGQEAHNKGFIVKRYDSIYRNVVLPYLMPFNLSEVEIENSTAIVLADGLSSQFQVLMNTLYQKLGAHIHYIGGGAGFYDMIQRPCLFTEKGLLKDAMIVCLIPSTCTHAVSHGFKISEGPYHITQSLDNVLYQLDHASAFEVYSNALEYHENIQITREDFFNYAKENPFGIILPHTNELIVRDPITVNEQGDITCVANVPEGSELYVLHGNVASLLLSSLSIVDQCKSKTTATNYEALLFDCISRAMFLQDSFNQELINIQNSLDVPIMGSLCIGEITSQSDGTPIIHNKSTVLCLLHNDEMF